jgi:hypothetical protein
MKIKLAVVIVLLLQIIISAQQIKVSRIEQMPDAPSPYLMRDWKGVAKGYDSLVFNFNLTGQYLPAGWINNATINYPAHSSFGLDSYIGTSNYHSGEALSALPAVIGATLIGIDKSAQNGKNWVLYCEEYFNKRPAENVYLNSPSATSGDDWWYATMPNVFFYQLYDLYRGTGDFTYQFKTVADRWLQAVNTMGGSATPWSVPNMEYRGWYLSTMKPFTSGVREPEASGALAWLFYNAYNETGSAKYRMGAEWALEFLNSYYANPSYELQMAYGVNVAARMNAEVGTNYDIEKMFDWCFDVGSLRYWGAIVGSWGGYDVSGLIGEVNDNYYAFAMNGFEQAGALVPIARYDSRYARAIGKWILNLANASRLFYSGYLPTANQDSKSWAAQYDPNSYIAHEALRQYGLANNSPYATGDAISGGWAATNLSLYSSSHVGTLAGIIDTTNVSKILKLDLLKTDYFHKKAYSTYLYYNPYADDKLVEIDAGSGSYDLYNTVSKTYAAKGISGKTNITIPASGAAIIVIVPANGAVIYNLNKMLINGVVVDYYSGASVSNYPPRIKSLAAVKQQITVGDSVNIYCTAVDKDNDTLSYEWSASGGSISETGNNILWRSAASAGSYSIICKVKDTKGGTAVDTVIITESVKQHSMPYINSIKAAPGKLNLGASADITCSAVDTGGSAIEYSWKSSAGTISGSGSKITWKAPGVKGNYYVLCTVKNAFGETVTDSVGIPVRDLSNVNKGDLAAYYPFNGNANDASGFGNNGTAYATLTSDRKGNSNSAYSFNGVDQYVLIPNNNFLNFRDSITVNFWMNIGELYQREAFPVSHGSWENRWKVSITNNKIRWTIKTANGTKDLDSKTVLNVNKYYNVTVYYDGSDMEIYINGELDNFTSFTGLLNTTTYDLTIGQILPNNKNYNFKGIIDDLRIYDYALSVSEIQNLSDIATSVKYDDPITTPKNYALYQNYPNPFNPSTVIKYQIAKDSKVNIKVYDPLGREVATIVNEWKKAGSYTTQFEADKYRLSSGIYYYRIQAGNYSETRKLMLIK